MMDYQFDLVGKIGSMALIRKEDKDIDTTSFPGWARNSSPA